jgi:hypothetical protein
MWSFVSFLAGLALGLNHFRMYHRSMLAMLDQGQHAPHKRLAFFAGLFRHVFTFTAGILLIRVARFEPFHLCGGLFVATVVYRGYLLSSARAA